MREEKNIKGIPEEGKTGGPEEIVSEIFHKGKLLNNHQHQRSNIKQQKNKTWKYIIILTCIIRKKISKNIFWNS
jgi:hypothetical protein